MSAPHLPEGWKALTAPDGRLYYANTVSGATQWVIPTMPAAAAAAGAAAPAPTAPHPAPVQHAPAPHPAAPHAAAPHVAAPQVAPGPKQAAAGDARYTLSSLVEKTGQRDMGQGLFELERDKLLEINLPGNQFAWIKHGTMIARRGNVKFMRQSMKEQGFKKVRLQAHSSRNYLARLIFDQLL